VRRIRELARDQKGGTLIEYGLILALIFVAMMVAVQTLATKAVGTLNYVKNEIVKAPDI
jgi:pilus assembly protein Flp/PilA